MADADEKGPLEAEQKIAEIFRAWDVSGTGAISEAHLGAVLLKLGVAENHIQTIFTAADLNKDGFIDYSEFVAWICGSSAHVTDVRERLENPRVLSAVGVSSDDPPSRLSVDGGISEQELSDLRAQTRYLVKPTPIVRRTFEAIFLILNVTREPSPKKAPPWSKVQKMLQDPDLGDRLRSFGLEALRSAPGLTGYLIQNYFGPGGEAAPAKLTNGDEPLTLRRVKRASKSAALIFKWSCKELIGIGALLPPPEDSDEDEGPENPPTAASPEPDPEELARQQRNEEAPALIGDLATLPSRDTIKEPHQVLFQLMTGSSAEASSLAEAFKSTGPCDRCDGAHHALDCPHFGPHKGHKAWTPRSRGREDHRDAWANLDKVDEGDAADKDSLDLIVRGRWVRQPGDGSCLYHSLSYGLRKLGRADAQFNGHSLRKELADWCKANSDCTVAGSTFREYIWWDHKLTVCDYCTKMHDGGAVVWGGAIEIAACRKLYGVQVHIYSPEGDGYRRIAAFGEESTAPTVAVIYVLQCHYDALEISGGF